MTPSESAFLDEEVPDFGMNKQAPLANIPQGFGEASSGPKASYRSVNELTSMLKGETKSSS